MTEPTEPGSEQADQAVWRSLRFGGLIGGLVAIAAAAWFGSSGGEAGIVLGLTLGLFIGLAMSCGWLMLAVAVDAMAGERPSAARICWLAGLLGAALIAPPIFLRLLS